VKQAQVTAMVSILPQAHIAVKTLLPQLGIKRGDGGRIASDTAAHHSVNASNNANYWLVTSGAGQTPVSEQHHIVVIT